MSTVVAVAVLGCLVMLTPLVLYEWVLAIAAVLPAPHSPQGDSRRRTRFVVLIPAHDEELGIGATLRSVAAMTYPRNLVRAVVIADRCQDRTAEMARRCGAECLERVSGAGGKGAAIAWGLEHLRHARAAFDAVVIIDADTVAHPRLLDEFAAGLAAGHGVQQGYNYLSNPWESPFTRVIAVTAILRNGLFYGGKARFGLSAMLTGTGMCFSRGLLERRRWDAFSVGEDWEFSASLLLAGEAIHFNPQARVFARESHGFKQASSQRLRWASGRHAVAATGGRQLLSAGVRERRLVLCDAALNLSAPTYSAQASLAIAALAASALLFGGPWQFLSVWAAVVTAMLAGYFLLGVLLTDAPLRALRGIALIPAFLPWRLAIEILGVLGYGRKQWVRTSRLQASR